MKRIITKQIGYSSIVYEIDTHDGEYTTTKVIINDQLLCVLIGADWNSFHEELKAFVNKYKT
jgi:hypothetical protein